MLFGHFFRRHAFPKSIQPEAHMKNFIASCRESNRLSLSVLAFASLLCAAQPARADVTCATTYRMEAKIVGTTEVSGHSSGNVTYTLDNGGTQFISATQLALNNNQLKNAGFRLQCSLSNGGAIPKITTDNTVPDGCPVFVTIQFT